MPCQGMQATAPAWPRRSTIGCSLQAKPVRRIISRPPKGAFLAVAAVADHALSGFGKLAPAAV
jgi:hypothetical protein